MRTILLLLLGWALCIGPPTSASAQDVDSLRADTLEPSRPDFRLLRQEESWNRPVGEEGGIASVKHIPLPRPGPSFVTVGGDLRTYGRWYRNEQWGRVSDRDAYLLQRVMLHGAVRITDGTGDSGARVFVQLKSGLVADRDGPVYPPDKDLLGVNQAFLEVTSSLGPDEQLTVRVGRQELHYGAGRMIAAREGPNVRLGFDTVLGRYHVGRWRGEVFVAKPTTTKPGVLDNGWIPGRTVWGLHARRGSALSVYYFGTERTSSPADGDLRAVRHTLGGRRTETIGSVGYAVEGAVQTGRYRRRSVAPQDGADGGPVRAWMLAGRVSLPIPRAGGQSTIGVAADVSSGDVIRTRAHETFAAPYPSGRYTGAGSRLGPGNLLNLRPVLDFRLHRSLRIELRGHVFWRVTASDEVYAIWGAPLRTATDTDARFIGAMPEGILTWDADRHVDIAVEGSYFKTGDVLQEEDAGEDMIHLGLRASYIF